MDENNNELNNQTNINQIVEDKWYCYLLINDMNNSSCKNITIN